MSHHSIQTRSQAPYAPTEVHAGQLLWLSPACGYHHDPAWHLAVSVTDGLVEEFAYVRSCLVEDLDGNSTIRCHYVRISGLLARDVG